MSHILVTGGAGFIGSNFVRRRRRDHPEDRLVVLDLLTYAGNLENLQGLEEGEGYRFVKGDIADAALLAELAPEGFDCIVNFAAESHVDRSIEDAQAFLRTNVGGTQALLDFARRHGVRRFVQVSTDEVYGSLGSEGRFTETTPLAPNSPYSASKAAADLLVRAAVETHGLDAVITRCSNNYGPFQFPEKLIPLMISNALEGKALPVYGDGKNVRDWIWVDDHCRGIELAMEKGRKGEVYNFGGASEMENIEVVRHILRLLGRPDSLIRHVEDRKGHDRRYAIDFGKAERELGFRPAMGFDEGIERTVAWYRGNEAWWSRIKSGEYRDWYDRTYGKRPGAT